MSFDIAQARELLHDTNQKAASANSGSDWAAIAGARYAIAELALDALETREQEIWEEAHSLFCPMADKGVDVCSIHLRPGDRHLLKGSEH